MAEQIKRVKDADQSLVGLTEEDQDMKTEMNWKFKTNHTAKAEHSEETMLSYEGEKYQSIADLKEAGKLEHFK